MSRLAFPVIVLGLVACGGTATEPLLGVWQVGVHTHDAAGCAAPGSAATAPAYVEFVISDVMGQDVLELVDCTAPGACDASHGLSNRLYTTDLPGGRRAEVFTAFGDSGACALAAYRSDAVIAADGTLHVESRRYEERDLSGVICTGATARTMLGALPCLELDRFDATVAAP